MCIYVCIGVRCVYTYMCIQYRCVCLSVCKRVGEWQWVGYSRPGRWPFRGRGGAHLWEVCFSVGVWAGGGGAHLWEVCFSVGVWVFMRCS